MSDPFEMNRRAVLAGLAGTGVLAAAPAEADASAEPEAQARPGYYPPSRTGLRGSHPGSFEGAHALRDGTLKVADTVRTDDAYDLIVVGGGISGLSAAHFYRAARPGARILILDNHDDFGGHAKRNEIEVDGHMLLLNGGTLEIDSPRPYSAVAAGLLATLDIHPTTLDARYHEAPAIAAAKLRRAIFFDKENYGRDALVPLPGGWRERAPASAYAGALDQAPLSPRARADLIRLETGAIDYLAGMSQAAKTDRLSRISYKEYLATIAKVDPQLLDVYQTVTHGEFGIGIDAESALDCYGIGLPGFAGLGLDPRNVARMGNTAAGYSATGGSATFHFPDGNATVARALVRDLIPAAAPAGPIEGLVTARLDYAALDGADQPVRLRLNSIAVNVVRRDGGGVDVAYLQAGQFRTVSARHCVLACYNMMIPYLVPTLPEPQKAALHQLVKIPLVYTTVALRNWRAFAKLGVLGASCPGGYFSSFRLFPGPQIGTYQGPRTPDDPIVVHMLRTPCMPGATTERDQHRAGRAELLATPLDVFEDAVHDQLGRALGDGGFDAKRDIAAIVVNRWPHGYAYEYNPLYDPWGVPERERPHVIGRQRFGPIAIANSDSGAQAYTDCAIDQAHRAVGELLG